MKNFTSGIHLINSMSIEAMKFTMNMPDDIHKKLKIEAAKKGTTVTDILLNLIEKHQKSK